VHLAAPLTSAARAALTDWFARGRPAMVCHGDPGGAAGVVLEVTLPAARWLGSIRFTVGHTAIVLLAPPLPLAEAISSAPPGWRDSLLSLDGAAASLGVPLSVTGSLAWQHLTGEPYLVNGSVSRSPVELHFRPRTRRELEGMLAILRVREDGEGPPLGGEVVLGWNDAVAWRDLAHGRRRVLVRGAGNEAVVDVERLLAGLR
jgi:phosphoribosyl-dephospho-CoA transferase